MRALRVACGTLAVLAGSGCGPGPTRCDDTVGKYTGWVDGDVCAGVTPAPGTPNRTLELIASDLSDPVWAGAPAGDVGRLFVIEQRGVVRIVDGIENGGTGMLGAEPFLSITGRVSCCNERGLLSLAFHPDFRTNGRFFVYYTSLGGAVVISEFSACPDGNVADSSSERELLRVNQPFANHNGGQLQFGPDGYLYVGTGDGGSAGDPMENSQNLDVLLGKLLRIDVDTEEPYAIPADNPFVGIGSPEIWAYGLRNPWRFSFDRETGDLYIGDVGQDVREEIDVSLAADGGGRGLDYGWDNCEGDLAFEGSCAGSEPPVLVYDHFQGCSVTGGFVYRGCAMPGWHGAYFYSDYCVPFTRTFVFSGGAVADERDLTADFAASGLTVERPSSFGEDGRGELYLVDHAGEVFRVTYQ